MAEKSAVEFMVEDATLLFKNFSGRATQYNREGDRNFTLVLSDDIAARLAEDDWNVRVLPGREEGEPDRSVIEVAVKFGKYPPKIILISNGGKTRTRLDEDMVSILDSADIANWDLMINPSFWEFNGKEGVKAYLKSAYITLEEDALDRKYGAIPEA